MILKYLDQQKEFDQPVRLHELLPDDNLKYLCAKVNNRLRELDYIVSQDAVIEFLDLTSTEAVTMYQSTLRYLVAMAIKRLYPAVKVRFDYSISRSIFTTLDNFDGILDHQELSKIEAEVNSLVQMDLPINRTTMSKEEATKYYLEMGYEDKAEIIKYRLDETVHAYVCDSYTNYMFGYMVPSTRFINQFKFRLYAPGFLMQYPRSETKGLIPEFEDALGFAKALKEHANWGKVVDGSSIVKMNKIVEENRDCELINLCETRHNNQLSELGQAIKAEISNIRLIAIAGPTSSGKTTFTNRLRIQLMSLGINPLMISIDDFYLGIPRAPKDEEGRPDLEHINALDIEHFNECMYGLISGNEVTLPHFDFHEGTRKPGKVVKLLPGQPIMIEGIHALNDDLTPSIPLHQKYKIYIAPQAQYHIDDHNPISITDIRLIRRLVRDHKYRNYPAIKTLEIWKSVRRGEFKWVYPYQDKANFIFNSELTYELCVMKKEAMALLQDIPNDSEFFVTANRLVKFLKYFKDIEETWIPCNSIMREFIGGSIFYKN